jgi:hypothetical protein
VKVLQKKMQFCQMIQMHHFSIKYNKYGLNIT